MHLSGDDEFFRSRINLVKSSGERYQKLKACVQGVNVKIRHSEFNDPNIKVEVGDRIEVLINDDVTQSYSIISSIFCSKSLGFPATHQLKISLVS